VDREGAPRYSCDCLAGASGHPSASRTAASRTRSSLSGPQRARAAIESAAAKAGEAPSLQKIMQRLRRSPERPGTRRRMVFGTGAVAVCLEQRRGGIYQDGIARTDLALAGAAQVSRLG
jgi:hypothetical protein